MPSDQPIVHKEPAVLTNPFAKHASDHINAGTVAIESERAIAEAQGKLVIAKRFPRDQARAYAAIIDACRRPGLAEEACYSFPRGGQTVSGPSIRLAEMLAANWGNIDYGIRELSRKEGVSEMEAYCWDLESNTMSSQKFTVRHIRDTRGGGVKLTDERDIYELTANMGGRRLRARILAIIPADLIQAAVDECSKTMAGGAEIPLADRVRNMVTAFKTLGVAPALIEKRLGHALDASTGEELGDLRKIHNSIRDGVSKIGDWFGDGPRGEDEQMPGDPAQSAVEKRPEPKPKSLKGAATVKENAVAQAAPPAPQTLQNAPQAMPAADLRASEPMQKPAAPVQAAPDKPAETAAPVAAPAPAAPAKPEPITQKAMLGDGATLTVEAQIDAYKVVVGKRDGKDYPYVTADIVSPEFKGQVSQTDNGIGADGKPVPAWQLDAPVVLKLRGKRYRSGTLVTIVDSIEIAEASNGGAPESPVAKTDEV